MYTLERFAAADVDVHAGNLYHQLPAHCPAICCCHGLHVQGLLQQRTGSGIH